MPENKQFNLQRIYLKDASLEMPHAPAVFKQAWKPKMDVQVNTQVQAIEGQQDHYEVTLQITVTASNGEETAYIVEVKQAGIFSHQGLSDEELKPALGVQGPTALFPYVRQSVADLVMKASFPQFVLPPMNFEALYQQHLKQAQDDAAQPATH